MLTTPQNKSQSDALGSAAQMVAEAHLSAGTMCICGHKPVLHFDIVLPFEDGPQLLAFGLCSMCLDRPFNKILNDLYDAAIAGSKKSDTSGWQPML